MKQHAHSRLIMSSSKADLPHTISPLGDDSLEGTGVQQERDIKGELLLSSPKSFY
jgi:hypothetical protein